MTDNVSLAVFDPIKADLGALATKDANLVFDHTTPDGETELRSYVRRLRGYKGDIDRIHKDAKRGALEFGRKLDAMKNELTDGVQKIIDARMRPLDEIEARKRAEAEAVIEAERLAAEAAERERLAEIERRESEIAAREAAIRAKEEQVRAAQREVEQIEREQIERERLIAREAATRAVEGALAKAKADAERAEREKREAVEAAERKAKAEADRIEKERLAEELRWRREKEVAAEAERKRVANKKHRERIETEAFIALHATTKDSDVANSVLEAVKAGGVPHITINY